MRDQYSGDISDFFKYMFIRHIALDRRIGVAWYYIPHHDGRNDGKHIEWQMDTRFSSCDPKLAHALSHLSDRSVAAIEGAEFWPTHTTFHRQAVPSSSLRSKWAAEKRLALIDADFVFCDPDNGIGSTNKHLTIEEIHKLRRIGRAVSFITFPARTPHEQQVTRLHERLHQATDTRNIITVRTSISVRGPNGKQPRARWFTVIDGDQKTHTACKLFGDRLRTILGARIHVYETTAA